MLLLGFSYPVCTLVKSDKATQKQVKKYVSEGVLKEIKGSKEQIRTLFLWESKRRKPMAPYVRCYLESG